MKTRRVRGGKLKTRKNRTAVKKGTQLDIIAPKQIAGLEKMLKKGGVTIVFVYADWCPHCHNYKPMWNDICKSKGSNVNMVSVNEKVISQTSIPSRTTIEGYPTVIAVNSITGETTNIPNYRNVSAMKNLVANVGNISVKNNKIHNKTSNKNVISHNNIVSKTEPIEDAVIDYMNNVEPGIVRTATPYPRNMTENIEEEKISIMPPQSEEDFINTLGYTNEQFTKPIEQRGGYLRRLRRGY